MTEVQAANLMNAVRMRTWLIAVAWVMGEMQDQLLEPIFEQHPQIRSPSLGGRS